MPEIVQPARVEVPPAQVESKTQRVGKKVLIVNPAVKSPVTKAIDTVPTKQPGKASIKPKTLRNKKASSRRKIPSEPAFSRTPGPVPPAPRSKLNSILLKSLLDDQDGPVGSDEDARAQQAEQAEQRRIRDRVAPPVGSRVPTQLELGPTGFPDPLDFSTGNVDEFHDAPKASPERLTANLLVTASSIELMRDAEESVNVQFDSDVPQLRVSTVGPNTLTVGRSARYTITLNNKSNFAAYDVKVRCAIPAWVSWTNTSLRLAMCKHNRTK